METTLTCDIERIQAILDAHGNDPARLISILQAVQAEYRYLPEDALALVAESLNLPPARVYGVATFYAHFALEPKGKHVVKLCDGTACHVRGSIPILEALRKRLGLTDKKETTDDMMFTVETVSCLGACGLAPAVVIDDEVHGQVTPAQAVELIEAIMKEEAAHV